MIFSFESARTLNKEKGQHEVIEVAFNWANVISYHRLYDIAVDALHVDLYGYVTSIEQDES